MSRTPKNRKVACQPGARLFKPAGVRASEIETVVLPLDCYEALRLADLEGLNQEQVAEHLDVSRPTVSRILEKGRAIVARALVEGMAIMLQGGPVETITPKRWAWRHGKCWRDIPESADSAANPVERPRRGRGRGFCGGR